MKHEAKYTQAIKGKSQRDVAENRRSLARLFLVSRDQWVKNLYWLQN